MSEPRLKEPKRSKGLERIFFLVLLLFFVFHFGLTLIYTLPKDYFPPKLRELVAGYMYPSFYQGWSLFAPDVPGWHSSIQYRYYRGGAWSDWTSTEAIPEYSNHPVHARVSQKFAHYLTNLVQENLYYENGKAQFDRVLGQGHYRSAVYLVRAHLNRQQITDLDSLQLQLLVKYAPEPGSGNASEQKVVDFPVLAINPKE